MDEVKTFDEFERDWKRRHRSSIPKLEHVLAVQEWFWIIFWLVVSIGAAIYSGSHTIPAAELTLLKTLPDRDRLALTAFIIIELVIFGAAAKRKEIDWLKWLLLGSIIVALAGNIGSSVTAVAQNGGDWLNQLGGVLLAILAPLTAFAAGEVFHIQLDKRAVKIAEASDKFMKKMRALEATINTAYKNYLSEVSEVSVRPDTDTSQTRQASYGYQTSSDGQLMVIAHLNQHPEDATLGSRPLGVKVGVSHDTANKGRKEWQRQQAEKLENGKVAGDE